MLVLVTGGAGYIGSTVAHRCADEGWRPIILDDMSTGLESMVGRHFPVYCDDYSDPAAFRRIINEHGVPDIVIHMAAKIVVPESVADPLGYYRNNVVGTLNLLENMLEAGCERLVFSSSGSLYSSASGGEVDEDAPVHGSSPYAATKEMCERMIADACISSDLKAISLRYFNPVGADPKMRCGLPKLSPSHALGKIMTADEKGEPFVVTGTDFPTRDGSGLRDYIHVWDLAEAHINASRRVVGEAAMSDSHDVFNLGTGTGTTVLELVAAYEKVVGRKILVEYGPRRPGDVAGCSTIVRKAEEVLGWRSARSLESGIADSLSWKRNLSKFLSMNPEPESAAE